MQLWRFGPDICVGTNSVPLADALDKVYSRLRVAEFPAAKRTIILAADEADGAFLLRCDGLPVMRAASFAELVPLVESLLDTYAGHATWTKAVFHAGVLSIGGRGVLFSGESGAGKSTATLALALRDHVYFGDDLCFVDFETLSVEAMPKAATLKQGSFGLFPDSEKFSDPVRGPVRYLLPPRVAAPGETMAIHAMIFPCYEKDATLKSRRLSKPLAALALVQQSFLGVHRDPRKLGLIARLAEIPAWHVTFSKMDDFEQIVRELIA